MQKDKNQQLKLASQINERKQHLVKSMDSRLQGVIDSCVMKNDLYIQNYVRHVNTQYIPNKIGYTTTDDSIQIIKCHQTLHHRTEKLLLSRTGRIICTTTGENTV